jgi:hypothetical protein
MTCQRLAETNKNLALKSGQVCAEAPGIKTRRKAKKSHKILPMGLNSLPARMSRAAPLTETNRVMITPRSIHTLPRPPDIDIIGIILPTTWSILDIDDRSHILSFLAYGTLV